MSKGRNISLIKLGNTVKDKEQNILTHTHTEELPLVLSRKLAVWAATRGCEAIGRWPSAIPTMAVICVSVPKT